MTHVAQTFERLLEEHRREDGRRWGGAELERATGSVVTRSYFVNLRKGRIENPGLDKLAAIAKTMGFAPALWFEDQSAPGRGASQARGGLASRVERMFEIVRDPETGEAHTNAGIARKSPGVLTVEGIEEIRSGAVTDPPLSCVVALARAFGVEPSYLVDRTGEVLFDGEVARALSDGTVREVALGCARLPRREKGIILGIVRQFEAMGEADAADPVTPPADPP